jgi:hypothetical protein
MNKRFGAWSVSIISHIMLITILEYLTLAVGTSQAQPAPRSFAEHTRAGNAQAYQRQVADEWYANGRVSNVLSRAIVMAVPALTGLLVIASMFSGVMGGA